MVAGRRIIKFDEYILEDLAAFTGMSIDSIENYFDKSECDHTRIELDKFVRPQTLEQLIWYYRCCRSEFVHNATKYHDRIQGKKGWPVLDKWVKPGMLVLDYGAGTGQNSIHVRMDLKAIPSYFEISIIQREFFKFRCLRRGWVINIIDPYISRGTRAHNYVFDPIYSVQGTFDVICLSQVLEHVILPGKLLEHLIKCLKNSGLLLEDTPWQSHDLLGLESWTVNQFESFMKVAGMEKLSHGVWQKGSV